MIPTATGKPVRRGAPSGCFHTLRNTTILTQSCPHGSEKTRRWASCSLSSAERWACTGSTSTTDAAGSMCSCAGRACRPRSDCWNRSISRGVSGSTTHLQPRTTGSACNGSTTCKPRSDVAQALFAGAPVGSASPQRAVRRGSRGPLGLGRTGPAQEDGLVLPVAGMLRGCVNGAVSRPIDASS